MGSCCDKRASRGAAGINNLGDQFGGKSHCSQHVCLFPDGSGRKIKFHISRSDPRGCSARAPFGHCTMVTLPAMLEGPAPNGFRSTLILMTLSHLSSSLELSACCYNFNFRSLASEFLRCDFCRPTLQFVLISVYQVSLPSKTLCGGAHQMYKASFLLSGKGSLALKYKHYFFLFLPPVHSQLSHRRFQPASFLPPF